MWEKKAELKKVLELEQKINQLNLMRAELSNEVLLISTALKSLQNSKTLEQTGENSNSRINERLQDVEIMNKKLWLIMIDKTPTGKEKLSKEGKRMSKLFFQN